MLFYGIDPRSMLCLTFTNRAAREMGQRIKSYIGHIPAGLFTGNIHSFCLRFLFANGLIADDTSIIDDDDMAMFIRESFDDYRRCNPEDIQRTDMILTMRAMGAPARFIPRERHMISERDREEAATYRRFKSDNNLIDYNDILILAWQALTKRKDEMLQMTHYRWIQVDEVQDLSPLQLELIRLVRADLSEVLFLGDEQQSIYGFAGAGISALHRIRRACGENIYHLTRNYRSPRQLVEFCNNYAGSYLDIDEAYLPSCVQPMSKERCLQLAQLPAGRAASLCAAMAKRFLANAGESTAILTRTNAEAERMSALLTSRAIEHILVGRRDLFRTAAFKTVWSHLAAVSRPSGRSHWARLLYQTHSTQTLTGARQIIGSMWQIGIEGHHLLEIDSPTELERFMSVYDNPDATIVVLDTETTGLDVSADDIVQVSAVKIRNGIKIPGSELSMFIETSRPIPAYLGEIRNPIFDIYRNAARLSRDEAFHRLSVYLFGCTLAGHNVEFDRSILLENYSRSGLIPPDCLLPQSRTIDTLQLARLLYPRLRSHTLNNLIGYLGIKGVNSHNSDDDTDATASLLMAVATEVRKRLPAIEDYRRQRVFRTVSRRFDEAYGPLFRQSLKALTGDKGSEVKTLGDFFNFTYTYMVNKEFIKPLPHMKYVLRLIDDHIADSGNETSLKKQLETHLHELLTYNEGDLFAQNIVRERLVVMTVHKAKGMEMDNVLLLSAGAKFGDYSESLRVFYVAVSRAKQRLTLLFTSDPAETIGHLTADFHVISPSEAAILLMQAGVGGHTFD